MINESIMKQAEYEKAQMAQGSAGCGLSGIGEPKRETLTGRFRGDLGRARQQSKRANDLEELLYLLDKNPELARILDLVDALGNKY